MLLFILADGWGLTGACSLIVIMGTLANLASVASSIVVYKDWIVIIAGGDSQRLARKNIDANKLLFNYILITFCFIRNEFYLPFN